MGKDRKRRWLALGIESEIGRPEHLTYNTKYISGFDYYREKEEKKVKNKEQGSSIFDPVLCELVYNWFCPVGGVIIDPFAGGSVRGIIAAKMDYNYYGCDLRKEQIEANKKQRDKLFSPDDIKPTWL